MPGIRLIVEATLPYPPRALTARMLDVEQWREFRGYGPIPGIRSAVFELRTPQVVGSRIRVVNRDGSRHVEQVETWDPDRRVVMRFGEFSAPLRWLARAMLDTWDFTPAGPGCRGRREMLMEARSFVAYPCVWVISWWLKAALRRHLHELGSAPPP